ncbi:hypothetical protein FS749_002035 [Ceratobasidium sp. UAMH 11750]|nr:hypothetical protein FS749_002035 [Ceratobasidium sp. UAMH 11750]
MLQPEGIPTQSLGETRSVTYDQARRQLQTVRALLSRTIQDYLATCQLIQTTCSTTPQSSDPTMAEREQTLLAIDAELSTFTVEEASIRKAREILTDTRNLSKMTAPVYSLPSEVLARIFSEATCDCTNITTYDPTPPILSPVTLSTVCRQWRNVATRHQSLWTHLDLEVSRLHTHRGYYSPKIWEEYSQGALLYIHIHQYRSFGDGDTDSDVDWLSAGDDNQNPAPMVTRLLDFLTPLMPQVCSLNVTLSWPEEYILAKLLNCWTMHGVSGKPKALTLESSPEYILVELDSPLYDLDILESLEVLHLYNVVPPWFDWPFGNLIDLRLGAHLYDEDWYMTQSELVTMLTLCPKLQHLKLNGLVIENPQAITSNPVALNELRVLEVDCAANTITLACVLAIISPSEKSLRLEISLLRGYTNPHEALVAISLFLERSNVTTLHLSSFGEPCFASQIGPLSRVQTLVLNHCYFCDVANVTGFAESLGRYVNSRPVPSGSLLWPHLRALYLRDCIVEKEHLYRLVSLHSIRTLHMRGCYQSREADTQFVMDSPTSEEYVQLLSELVPNIAYFMGRHGEWPSLSN